MSSTFAAGTTAGATLSDFVSLLRQRLPLIGLIFSLVLLTTAGVTALLPKWYRATAKILVAKPESEVKLFQSQNNTSYDPYFIQDQFNVIQSEKILYRVIDQLNLGRQLAHELGASGDLTPAIAYQYLTHKMLQVESPRATSLIEIGVLSRDPRMAASIANAIARIYADDRINLATAEQREGLAKLRQELEKQELVVTAQRDQVEKLRKELEISGVDLNQRHSDMEIENLRQMQNSLIALRVDTIGRKTRWERFRSIPAEQRRDLVNSELITDSNIRSLLEAYLVSAQNLARLRSRLGTAHPDLVAAVDANAKIAEQLDRQLVGYENALEIAFKEAEARVQELERQLAQAKVDQILSARERMRPFEESANRLDDEQRLLTTLKLTLRQREIDFQVPKKTIEILNTAEPPLGASKPSWALNLVFACVFGVLLGVGAAVLVEYFDTSFRNVADVEAKLGVPVLGVIPFTHEPALSVEASSPEGEPHRVLQTNLNLALPAGRPAVLSVFSAGPGEGKSTTIHHLAQAMVLAGEKVLLIDSDVRRPTQHHFADVSREPGLAEVLQGKVELTAAIHPGTPTTPDFLPAGSGRGFALSLLYAEKLRALIGTCRGRYDRILLDAPPIIGVSDSSVLATMADGVLLLIQHRRNPSTMVLRAQKILAGLKTPLLGVILNQVPPQGGDDYGYYTANYSYYSHDEKGTRSPKKGSQGKSSHERPPERLDLQG